MSGGYPHNPPGYGYGPPPPANPYASAPPPSSGHQPPYGSPSPYGGASSSPSPYGGGASAPYGAPSAPSPYGAASDPYAKPSKPGKESKPYGSSPSAYGPPPPTAQPYGSAPPYGSQAQSAYGGASAPSAPGYGGAPSGYGGAPSAPAYGGGGYGGGGGGGSPFASLVPSQFPPGTDPSIVACFQMADQDGSGLIDDYELQRALSSYNQSFSMRTVHLLMYTFTNTNTRKIGPKEFTSLYYSLQNWRSIFERFDRDRSGKIDVAELRDALMSLGFSVSPVLLDLLVSKFDKSGGKCKAIEYDNFIECCLTVKGLTEKFKEKDLAFSGSATFTYETFMLTVLPFLIA